jgi:hypothetical protein
MIAFARETLPEVVQEVQPLLELHYRELIKDDAIVLDPQWDEYTLLERLGRFVIFTARQDGELAGYSAFFLTRHLHYKSLLYATNDVFYVAEAQRKGSMPLRFLRYCEDQLGTLGAQKLVYHAKPVNNLAPILSRMGYAQEEVMCGKFLKGA